MIDKLYDIAPELIGNDGIILFSMNNCANCVRQKKLYELKEMPFLEINVSEDKPALDFLLSLDVAQMPVTLLHNQNGEVEFNAGIASKDFLDELIASKYKDLTVEITPNPFNYSSTGIHSDRPKVLASDEAPNLNTMQRSKNGRSR